MFILSSCVHCLFCLFARFLNTTFDGRQRADVGWDGGDKHSYDKIEYRLNFCKIIVLKCCMVCWNIKVLSFIWLR